MMPKKNFDPDRNKEDRDQSNIPHGRAHHAADDHTPRALGQVTQHQNGHRAKRHSQPHHEAQQIGLHELLVIPISGSGGERGEQQPDDQRPLSDRANNRRRGQIQIVGRLVLIVRVPPFPILLLFWYPTPAMKPPIPAL